MDFLDKIIIPQSASNLTLLRYILDLTLVILVPYLSVVFGSSVLSFILYKRGTISNDKNTVLLSKHLIDTATAGGGLPFALGVVPMISVAFCYAQLLAGSGNSVSGYVVLALLFFLVGIAMLYVYKYSFHFKDILNRSKPEEELAGETAEYKTKIADVFGWSSLFGTLFIIVSSFLLMGSIQTAAQLDKIGAHSTPYLMFFSLDSITFFIQFIVLSVAVSMFVLFYFVSKENSEYEVYGVEYVSFVKGYTLRNGLIFLLITPMFIFANLLTKSDTALSTWYFFLLIVSFFLMVVLVSLAYQMLKESNAKYNTVMLVVLIVLLPLLVTKEQFAFSVATTDQYYKLVKEYDVYHADLEAKFGNVVVEVNGADIYNGVCSACHQFDQDMTGPAYNKVLDKYGEDVTKLSGFILNPAKVDDAYPAMPNQGLKPNEAKAVAEYLIKTYKERQAE